jgi:hypothetical protein
MYPDRKGKGDLSLHRSDKTLQTLTRGVGGVDDSHLAPTLSPQEATSLS